MCICRVFRGLELTAAADGEPIKPHLTGSVPGLLVRGVRRPAMRANGIAAHPAVLAAQQAADGAGGGGASFSIGGVSCEEAVELAVAVVGRIASALRLPLDEVGSGSMSFVSAVRA